MKELWFEQYDLKREIFTRKTVISGEKNVYATLHESGYPVTFIHFRDRMRSQIRVGTRKIPEIDIPSTLFYKGNSSLRIVAQ